MTRQNGLSADTQALMAFQSSKKSTLVAYLLWFFTGSVGGHRFYMGRPGTAVCQIILSVLGLFTSLRGGLLAVALLPILGIWLLIDAIRLGGLVTQHNNALMARLNAIPQQSVSSADDIAKFAALRDSGAISEAEFQAQKSKLLG